MLRPKVPATRLVGMLGREISPGNNDTLTRRTPAKGIREPTQRALAEG